jgi:hypothetical protein
MFKAIVENCKELEHLHLDGIPMEFENADVPSSSDMMIFASQLPKLTSLEVSELNGTREEVEQFIDAFGDTGKIEVL